ncbi:hypothetical protein HANVADRAFT_46945 [Hanseniaspora valbyensis NRRL Y-1626]|uniref:Stationary phase protein 4 n=1 Tax=Hanseniaspora valbyensis NRRL Y-1626 TaxID=766949 RepID=A0A1B7TJ39_9ASCO|nr:hypothetical protein HANVADRAFT_46945 [Hanseniaspora valbyensis NRRL Y-1626]
MDKFLNAFAVHNPNKHIKKEDNNKSYGGGGSSNSGRATDVIYSREYNDQTPSKQRSSSMSSMSETDKAEYLKNLPTTVDWTKMTRAQWDKIGEALPEDNKRMKNSPNNRVNV